MVQPLGQQPETTARRAGLCPVHPLSRPAMRRCVFHAGLGVPSRCWNPPVRPSLDGVAEGSSRCKQGAPVRRKLPRLHAASPCRECPGDKAERRTLPGSAVRRWDRCRWLVYAPSDATQRLCFSNRDSSRWRWARPCVSPCFARSGEATCVSIAVSAPSCSRCWPCSAAPTRAPLSPRRRRAPRPPLRPLRRRRPRPCSATRNSTR
ncbi:hypothetical protein D3C86_1388000 [compost metagenome]